MGPDQGFGVPDGALPVHQHWPGNWRVAEGTWSWAESIGLRAVAVESQDHFEGPPTRPSLRKQFFARDQQLHGTGELVSWARGRELAPMGLAAVLEGIEVEYRAFCSGRASEVDVEKRVCDLFMAARCGDYLAQLLQQVSSGPKGGWMGSLRRALDEQLLSDNPAEMVCGPAFWRRGVMPGLVRALPTGSWSRGLPHNGYRQDESLRFGRLVLWSSGACGQILREALHVDWTDLVLEQGVLRTLAGTNRIQPGRPSFATWLERPLSWRCRRASPELSCRKAHYAHLVELLKAKQPELGHVAWRVGPAQWARILEWVLVWRREISSPEMLERAQVLAALMLQDEARFAPGQIDNPIASIEMEHITPKFVGDIPTRLAWRVQWSHPQDFRLADELYPAIAAVVAAWLRGAGHASCTSDVFSKAPWLGELLPVRRLRMVEVLKVAAAYMREERDSINREGLYVEELENRLTTAMGISHAQLQAWLAGQATGPTSIGDFVLQLAECGMFAPALQMHLPERCERFGTALPAGINTDVLWGMDCIGQHLRSLPTDFSTPSPSSEGQVSLEREQVMAG